MDDLIARSPGLVRRGILALLWFFEWGGVVIWGTLVALAALGAWTAGWRGALVGAALGLPAVLFQRPPPAPLSLVPASWQRAYLESLADSRFYYRRMGYKLLSSLVLSAYYGQPAMQRALGYDVDARVVWSRAEPNPGSLLDGHGKPSGSGIPRDRSDGPDAGEAGA